MRSSSQKSWTTIATSHCAADREAIERWVNDHLATFVPDDASGPMFLVDVEDNGYSRDPRTRRPQRDITISIVTPKSQNLETVQQVVRRALVAAGEQLHFRDEHGIEVQLRFNAIDYIDLTLEQPFACPPQVLSAAK